MILGRRLRIHDSRLEGEFRDEGHMTPIEFCVLVRRPRHACLLKGLRYWFTQWGYIHSIFRSYLVGLYS